jgi:hypothetical protein
MKQRKYVKNLDKMKYADIIIAVRQSGSQAVRQMTGDRRQ